jgi:CheY-like chemotaxis protein
MKILLIEDSPDQAYLFHLWVERLKGSHEITHCEDGLSAINTLSKDEARYFEVIFLDLRIPKMDGLKVLSWISEHSHLTNIPIVVLTSSNLEQDQNAVKKFNIFEYIIKPASLTQIYSVFERLQYLQEKKG